MTKDKMEITKIGNGGCHSILFIQSVLFGTANQDYSQRATVKSNNRNTKGNERIKFEAQEI